MSKPYKFILKIFSLLFSICICISDFSNNIYGKYENNIMIYNKVVKCILFGSIALTIIIARIVPNSIFAFYPLVIFLITIMITDIFETIYKASNSLIYFLTMIWFRFIVMAILLSQVFKESMAITIYLILCIFYGLVSNKKIAILANEINGSILSFIYTVMMHYKEKAAIFTSNFFINYADYEEKVNVSFQSIKNEMEESIDFICGKILIMIAISVISIVLLHLKEYWIEKYINSTLSESSNDG